MRLFWGDFQTFLIVNLDNFGLSQLVMLDNFKGFEKKAARVYVVIMIARGGLV